MLNSFICDHSKSGRKSGRTKHSILVNISPSVASELLLYIKCLSGFQNALKGVYEILRMRSG